MFSIETSSLIFGAGGFLVGSVLAAIASSSRLNRIRSEHEKVLRYHLKKSSNQTEAWAAHTATVIRAEAQKQLNAEQRFAETEAFLRKRISELTDKNYDLIDRLNSDTDLERQIEELTEELENYREELEAMSNKRDLALESYRRVKKSFNRRNKEIEAFQSEITELREALQKAKTLSFISDRQAVRYKALSSATERLFEECRITRRGKIFRREDLNFWIEEEKTILESALRRRNWSGQRGRPMLPRNRAAQRQLLITIAPRC